MYTKIFKTTNPLLQLEIANYRNVLAGVTETHRYVYRGSERVYQDVPIPEGVPFNEAIEHDLVAYSCRMDGISPDEVEYIGPISAEQALGAIMIRQEAMRLENAPAALGAHYARPGDKTAV